MVDSQVVAFTFVAAVLTLTPGARTPVAAGTGRHHGEASGAAPNCDTLQRCTGQLASRMIWSLGKKLPVPWVV